MALVHVAGTGIISWHFQVQSSDGDTVCTMGYQSDQTALDELGLKAFLRMSTTIVPLLSAHCSLHSVTVIGQVGANLESAEQFASGNVAGQGVTSMLPANCAVLIQKRTGIAGRKHRGRMYIPGIAGNSVSLAVDCNALDAGNLASFQSAADDLFDGLKDSVDGDPIHPMILHPPPNNTTTEVLALSVQARLATQRGRLRD